MIIKADKNAVRKKRHARVRAKLTGTTDSSSSKRISFKSTYLRTSN